MDYEEKLKIVKSLERIQEEKIKIGIKIKADSKQMKALEDESAFYKTHPFMVPFVGYKYNEAKQKILVVMESHYLPEKSTFYESYKNISHLCTKKVFQVKKEYWLKKNWYENVDFSWDNLIKQKNLKQEDINYIWTEQVVKENLVTNKNFQKLFNKFLTPIYKTIINPKETLINDISILETINYIAFMNYYLRPSETTGGTICVERIDEEESYKNIKKVYKALKNPLIVICSSKAGYSFRKWNTNHNNSDKIIFKENTEYLWLNHPSDRSWITKNFNSEKHLTDRLRKL